jgi:heat-inducible transcriptional repressor
LSANGGETMNDRQNKLLKEIVESYINEVKPVGSQALCKKFKLSSATIRNEMAELEKLGYLEKNHVSSGRIPSEKGYKYYVENLMKPKELNGEEILKLQTIVQNHQLQVSDTINQCMQIIAELTNYTSVVLGRNSSDNTLQQVNIIPLDDNQVIAVVCTNKGIVENRRFHVTEGIFMDELVKTCEIINKMLIGTPINEVSQRLEFEVKPVISKTIKQYEAVYEIFYDAFNDFTKNSSNVFFSGKTNILKQPEYNNIDEIKKIVNKFEDESLVKKIEESSDGINVYIGEESQFDPNVTVIKTKYNINGEEGTIAIVGPKRMEYSKVIALLEYLNEELNKR